MNGALTTADVARLLKCSKSQVIRYMDSGEMKSWKVPMSKHRRTSLEAVKVFAKKLGVSV